MGTITHAPKCNPDLGNEAGMAVSKWIKYVGPGMTITPHNITFIRTSPRDYYLFVCFLLHSLFPQPELSPKLALFLHLCVPPLHSITLLLDNFGVVDTFQILMKAMNPLFRHTKNTLKDNNFDLL